MNISISSFGWPLVVIAHCEYMTLLDISTSLKLWISELKHDFGWKIEDGYDALIFLMANTFSWVKQTAWGIHTHTHSPLNQGSPGATIAMSSIQTYFLHDVVDPGWRAVAEVRALGIPVAHMGHAYKCSHACKTSRANRVRRAWHSPGDRRTLVLLGILSLQCLLVWEGKKLKKCVHSMYVLRWSTMFLLVCS